MSLFVIVVACCGVCINVWVVFFSIVFTGNRLWFGATQRIVLSQPFQPARFIGCGSVLGIFWIRVSKTNGNTVKANEGESWPTKIPLLHHSHLATNQHQAFHLHLCCCSSQSQDESVWPLTHLLYLFHLHFALITAFDDNWSDYILSFRSLHMAWFSIKALFVGVFSICLTYSWFALLSCPWVGTSALQKSAS